MITTCLYCKKEFNAKPYGILIGRKKYCSKECKNNAQNKKIKFVCKTCGNDFYKSPSSIKFYGNIYCSKSCEKQDRTKETACLCCGKIFRQGKSDIHKYCSRDCYLKHNSVTKTCLQCGKVFTVPKSNADRYEVCSRACKKIYRVGNKNPAWKGGKIKIMCVSCGKAFVVFPSREGYRKVCHDPKCLSKIRSENVKGDKCVWWQGGISYNNPYPQEWYALRKEIRIRDDHTCVLCGKRGIHLHHIDYNKKNCDPENLISLCNSEHIRTNNKREYWARFFQIVMEN